MGDTMKTISISPYELNDAELVEQSLAGDRQAFGRIVGRYQSLVCALAYSATGSRSRSEDLAQETFVAAWRDCAICRRRPGSADGFAASPATSSTAISGDWDTSRRMRPRRSTMRWSCRRPSRCPRAGGQE